MINSLAEVHLELASEWSEKNLLLKPDEVNAKSRKNVWWRCGKCGNEWKCRLFPNRSRRLFYFKKFFEKRRFWVCISYPFVQMSEGTISTIMNAAGFGTPEQTTLPAEMVTTIEDCGFFESIPLWAVTLIGGLFITVLSFILIMTVYGRFFKLYMYTALAPIPLSTFAGEPTQNVGKSFIKSYCAVLLEGAVIVLACIIFSVFASSPPVVNPDAAAVTQVWAYIGELVFNMLVLVGAVKMSDRIIREMMGL